MNILIATEKPFAPAAVEGIRHIVESSGHTLRLLEKYPDKATLLAAVADADALIIRSDRVDADVTRRRPHICALWCAPVPAWTTWISTPPPSVMSL